LATDELTPEEIIALADAFPVGPSSRTLLRMARFPAGAIPVGGYSNALEFWTAIADEVASGVMPDGRRQILAAARRKFPYSTRFPDPAGAAAAPAGPLRVLVLGASPAGLPWVRTDQEARRIEDAAAAGRVAIEYVAAAMATDLERVRAFRPGIVHFICHGDSDRLAFNDPRGEYDLVKASRIAETLGYYRDSAGVRLRAVVLAACDGNTLAPYFTGVADTVIGHRGKLADPCGIAFAAQFYRLLTGAAGQGEGGLAGTAREAAVLTVALSEACAPVQSNLIVLSSGG